MINENECQKQDINQLQFTNKILEEHIYKNNIRQNKKNNQMQAKEKNDKNKEMEISKKKNGINSKLIYFLTQPKKINKNFNSIYF